MTRFYRSEAEHAAAIEAGTKSTFVVGLDLGQSADPSAIAALEVLDRPDAVYRPNAAEMKVGRRRTLALRHLERLPLQTSYTDVVSHVGRLLDTAPLRGDASLVIDLTGVGRPVFDMFEEARLRPIGVSITSQLAAASTAFLN
jgi:hypothetical protein